MYECNENFLFAESGEGGIRTLGTFPPTRFPVVPNRPLSHLSEETKKHKKLSFLEKLSLLIKMAERVGFEPT